MKQHYKKLDYTLDTIALVIAFVIFISITVSWIYATVKIVSYIF